MKKLKNYLCLFTIACVCACVMTGCGNNGNGSTSGNNKNNNNNNNAVENAADDVGNAVEDVADGVGNAVNDLVGNNGFDNYNDAHDYFLNTMSGYHSDAQFEVRDEDRNLNDYQEGSKGYRFRLYDTSNNKDGELFGEFYVDSTSGLIYKKDENGNIIEYRGNNTNGNTNNNNAGNGVNNNSNNGTGSNTNNNQSTNNK